MTERDAKILELRKQGLSSAEIRKALHISSSSVVRGRLYAMKRQGVEVPPYPHGNTGRPREHDHEAIIAYYLEGHSQQGTAKHFNISARAVSYVLQNNNVPINPAYPAPSALQTN